MKLLDILKEIITELGDFSNIDSYNFESSKIYGDYSGNDIYYEFQFKENNQNIIGNCKFTMLTQENIKDNEIDINFNKKYINKNSYSLDYWLDTSTNTYTGSNKEDKINSNISSYLKVINTINKITLEFINKYKPNSLIIRNDDGNNISYLQHNIKYDPKINQQKMNIYYNFISKNIPSSYKVIKDNNNNIIITNLK